MPKFVARSYRFAFVLALMVTLTGGAAASEFAELVKALNADSFSAKADAAEALAAGGDPRAAVVLHAFAEGRLSIRDRDETLIVVPIDGKPLIAATLEPAIDTAADSLQPLSVNNRLRGTLQALVGRMGLLSSDRKQRQSAAEAALRAPSIESAPLLRQALETEKDKTIADILTLALAASDVTHAEREKRLVGIARLAETTDPRVRGLLQRQHGIETDPEVKAVLVTTLKLIEQKLALIDVLANLVQGLSLGSILLLAAIGLAVTFGVMGVINMAHGEMIMLGAYTAFVVQEIFRAYLPSALIGWYLPTAVPVAFLVAGGVGVAIERSIIRWLYGRPLETLLATWGVSLGLQQIVRSIFGATNKEVANPTWMTGGIDVIGGLTLTYNRMAIIAFCAVVMAVLVVILNRTAFGLNMRAVTQNRRMAASMGIATGGIDALTFGLGSGLAGMAGVALSQVGNVSPNLGQTYIVDSFMVVVFGGVGSLWGTLLGAFSLGLVNKLLEPYAGAVLGKILVLVAIILFIQKRPRGLFALKGRAVES